MKKPTLIAEIGLNHEGDYNKCLEMIKSLAGKVDMVKFQIYTADKLAHKSAKAYWDTSMNPETNQNKLFQTQLTIEEYRKLSDIAHILGLKVCASVFDIESIKECQFVDVFKIASGDITFYPLIREIHKPIIISTGASYLSEIKDVLMYVRTNDITLLHCVLNYPTSYKDANLSRIQELKGLAKVGYSDHTIFNADLLVNAWLIGAEVIEKHFTYDKTRPGSDHIHSMDIKDVDLLNKKIKEASTWLSYSMSDQILAREQARRSIYTRYPLKKGDTISEGNIICLRPCTGISASEYYKILGNKLNKDVDGVIKEGDCEVNNS